jgi:putative DNA primase/helicase
MITLPLPLFSNIENMTNKEAAIFYAHTLGWRVFPCKENGKAPLTPRGFYDATRDLEEIENFWTRWPEANIGIATGKVNELFVIDIDTKNGIDGFESLKKLEREVGHKADTPFLVKTGSGGMHLYFKFGSQKKPMKNLTNLLPGIDVRGEGGYVIAPPSTHETGGKYSCILK